MSNSFAELVSFQTPRVLVNLPKVLTREVAQTRMRVSKNSGSGSSLAIRTFLLMLQNCPIMGSLIVVPVAFVEHERETLAASSTGDYPVTDVRNVIIRIVVKGFWF